MSDPELVESILEATQRSAKGRNIFIWLVELD